MGRPKRNVNHYHLKRRDSHASYCYDKIDPNKNAVEIQDTDFNTWVKRGDSRCKKCSIAFLTEEGGSIEWK